MVSRENLVTAAFVVLALPAAYVTEAALDAAGVGSDVAFGVAYAILLVVGVGVPRYVVGRLDDADPA